MTDWKYDITPNHRVEGEPLWYNILAEWSARPPSPREYRKHDRNEGITMWLRETWHAVNEKNARIKALETALKALTEKCDDFNAFWDDLDWKGVVNHAASSDLNTEHVLYFQTDFGTLDDGRPDTDEAKAALGGDA